MAERDFGIPATGTMAHSWVQSFGSELEAFEAYARIYPGNSIFLVDTYNVLRSGVPNAIKVMRDVLAPQGRRAAGIRIDSGDITYLSRESRRMLDEAGFPDCKILASNSLDEYIIRDIINQGACVDVFGVGERLITSRSEPVFGGVYKLAGIEGPGGSVEPRMKISENVEKITLPGSKEVVRLFSKRSGKAIADVICLAGEAIDEGEPYVIFDPEAVWKRQQVRDFRAVPLLARLFEGGRRAYEQPALADVRAYCLEQVGTLWEEILRFENPQEYFVDLSQPLWDLRHSMLMDLSGAHGV
jgi:nicotinate phosphoribosyltransferase